MPDTLDEQIQRQLYPQRQVYSLLGNLANNPNLLREAGNNLSDADFIHPFHRMVFKAINNLVYSSTQLKEINGVDIDNYLSKFSESYKSWELNKGLSFVNDAKIHANSSLFQAELADIKKYSLLRKYVSNGIDISDLYDFASNDEGVLSKGQQTIEGLSADAIVEHYTGKIIKIRNSVIDESGSIQRFEIKDDIGGLIDRLSEKPEMGYPFTNGYYNALFHGMRPGKYMLRSAETGLGKQVAYTSIVKMANGTDKMARDVEVGDMALGQDGKPTKVLARFPHKDKKFYRVTLADGRSMEVCDEHLVPVWSRAQRTPKIINNLQVKELGSMLDDYKYTSKAKNGRVITGNKYYLPLTESVKYPEQEHIISPYVLGVLIAEGSLNDINRGKLVASFNESDVLEKFINEAGLERYTHRDDNYSYNFSEKRNKRAKIIKDELRRLDLNHTTMGKFIPKEYLIDSIKNRKELLKGLMDADGCIVRKKDRVDYSLSYSTSSPLLRDTFLELVDGLGYGRSVLEDKRGEHSNWMIGVFTPEVIWSSKKHSERVVGREYRSSKHIYTQIVNIEYIGKQDGVCFTVDNKDHLFLIDDYIVTHNTRQAVRDLVNVSCDERYDNGKWINTGLTMPILFISTELNKEEIQKLVLAYLSGIETSELEEGNFDKASLERVKHAQAIIERSDMYLVYMEDFSVSDIELTIEDYIINSGVQHVVFDYIQNSGKLSRTLQEAFGHNLREDEIISNLSRQLKMIAEKFDIFMMSSTQVNGKAKEDNMSIARDANVLRGGRSTADKIDYGVLTFRVSKDDRRQLEGIQEDEGFNTKVEPNLAHWVYKNRAGRDHVVIWSYMNMGNMRETPLFVTDYEYNLIEDIDPLTFTITEKEDIKEDNSVKLDF